VNLRAGLQTPPKRQEVFQNGPALSISRKKITHPVIFEAVGFEDLVLFSG
jgi:hypothetical protein